MNTRLVRRFILTTLQSKDVIAFAFGPMNGGLPVHSCASHVTARQSIPVHPCEVDTVLCNICPMDTRPVRRFILTTLSPNDVVAPRAQAPWAQAPWPQGRDPCETHGPRPLGPRPTQGPGPFRIPSAGTYDYRELLSPKPLGTPRGTPKALLLFMDLRLSSSLTVPTL